MSRSVKIKKAKKRRRISMVAKSLVFFIFSLLLYLGTCLYTNTRITQLTMYTQELKAQCEVLKQENQELSREINTLAGKDRIYEAAKENDMTIDNNNIYALASMGGH